MSEQNTEVDELKAAIEALEKKNRELLGEVKTAKAKAKGADIDPAEHAALQQELENLREVSAKAEKVHQKEVESLTQKLAAREAVLKGSVLENGLAEAMLKANVKPDLMPAVKAMLKERAALTEDGEGFKALMGDKPLSEAILEWASSDEGKPFVLAADSSGGGAAGGHTPNGSSQKKGDLGGTKDERVAAIASRFPELAQK